MAASQSLENVTRRHGIKIIPPESCSVEECTIAVAEVIGYTSISSAARMNSAIVTFLDNVEKVNEVVVKGIAVNNESARVMPLVQPAKRITISNVPPFIQDDVIERELMRHSKTVSKIRKIPLGCRSPQLKHVVSFKRQTHMILNNKNEELNLAMKFKVDKFDYVIYDTSENMKCFSCGLEGHVIHACPEKANLVVPQKKIRSQEQTSSDKNEEQRQEEIDEESSVDTGNRDVIENGESGKERLNDVVDKVGEVSTVEEGNATVDGSLGFIAMIRVLYQDIASVLKINGSFCTPFKVERGIRQGCALSGMLYVLVIEPLLVKIRNSIEGWSIPYSKQKVILSAYADDDVLIKDQNDIMPLKKITSDFRLISSARVNWAKSEELIYGEWSTDVPKLPGGLTWKRDGIKYLGVYIGDDDIMQKNWEGVIEKVKGRLEKWKWLLPKMSYRGRVIVVNNLAASILWNRLTVLDPPSGLMEKLQTIIVDFFWRFNLASRRTAFRLLLIQRYLTGPVDLVWRKVADIMLSRVSGLNLNSELFLMDSSKLQTDTLTWFYKGL
ncbi:hypothetical protein QTP86_016804 [Hemibagrus guttatus]|nr:hypothetical protein QTP86_016804 [Hemibagrus guttatus]